VKAALLLFPLAGSSLGVDVVTCVKPGKKKNTCCFSLITPKQGINRTQRFKDDYKITVLYIVHVFKHLQVFGGRCTGKDYYIT
jgi:uracil phosphoribosyltransferase